MQQVVPLQLLGAGERGRVHDIDGQGHLVARLEEMGLRHGVEVHMLRPGSPCIIAVNNHRFSFRGDEAAVVLIEVGAPVTSG